MILAITLKKNILEKIVKQTFLGFGNITASQMLDSLKAFGFFYATSSGISIGLEDLKSPQGKKKIKDSSNTYISDINKKWLTGFLSDSERFQAILSHWFSATEMIKKEIVYYYKNYDPANSLYIMAFSGARGNISQVRQIVGIRGLMTNQSGNVISFPIKNNFREGLASVDYLVSAYGARKGVVDTALKTAVAGYLTRRLIFLAQDVIIRQIDCKTLNTLIIDVSRNSNCENLIGRYSELALEHNGENLKLLPALTSCFLTKKISSFLTSKKNKNIYLKIRSTLTCVENNALCQKCYGWDLSKHNKISLGEAVGIIAAQSIGEPGTQLTMRTFHTGGVFGGDLEKKFFSLPISGKVIFYKNVDGFYTRNIFGENILKLIKNLEIKIFHWKKGQKSFYIPKDLEFFLEKKPFIIKNEKMANFEQFNILENYGIKKVIPIYSPIDGQIIKENLLVKELNNTTSLVLANSTVEISLGKFFSFPGKSKYRNLENFNIDRSIAFLNILVAPDSGFLIKEKSFLTLYTEKKKYYFDIQNCKKICNLFFIKKAFLGLNNKLFIFPESYQFIDKGTICARVETFPEEKNNLFKIISEKKNNIGKKNLFCIRNSDIYTINADNFSNFKLNLKIGDVVNFEEKITESLKIPLKGKIIEKDGYRYTFQLIQSFFFPKGALFYKKNSKYTFKNELLSHSVVYKQQANDIVQGLPKIDQLIEANAPENLDFPLYSNSLFFNLKNLNILLEEKEDDFCNKSAIKSFNFFLEKNEIEKTTSSIFQIENSFYKMFNTSTFDQDEDDNDNEDEDEIFEELTPEDLEAWNGSNILKNIKQNRSKKTKVTLAKFKKNIYLSTENKSNFILAEEIPFSVYNPETVKTFYKNIRFFDFFQISDEVTENIINPHLFLLSYFSFYLKKKNSLIDASILSLQKLQLLIINSIQSVYYHQGVKLSNKHIELIARQLTSKVFVLGYSSQNFLKNEYTYLSLIKLYKRSISELLENFETNIFFEKFSKKEQLKTIFSMQRFANSFPKYIRNIEHELINFKISPVYLGSSINSLFKENGFMASASFQETRKNLVQAAVAGSKDWLIGLQESIIASKLMPAGSGYLAAKNYLDNIYFYKN